MLVKILGAGDIICGIVFLVLGTGFNAYPLIVVICAGFLLLKGMLVFAGDYGSAIDLIASLVLFGTLLLRIDSVFLFISAFILLAKGVVSFF